MTPRMEQSQTLSLQQVLAPQLQQSLHILQAPMLELRNLVQQELQENPVLEEEAPPETPAETAAEGDDFQEEFERLSRLDEEWRDYMAQSNAYAARSAEDDERRQFFFDSIVGHETLQQHLLEQLKGTDLDTEARKTAELIIGNIDDRGFLAATPEEMAQNSGVPVEQVRAVLEVVRSFHPVGVGALDLRDCLLIQLRRVGKGQTIEYRIVDRHLEDLGKHRLPEIARRLGTTVDRVQAAANFIATLDPKPGQLFAPDPNNYILPDVAIERVGQEYQVIVNGDQIPHLRISNAYKDLMAREHGRTDVREYIRDKIRSGKFLIKSIHQRQQTISNIAHEILKRQRDFMDCGIVALKPMTMVQVAEAVGVHETTVSRAISGKYLATPHGVFEMKFFFTPGYQTADGASVSNATVKETIADLARQEDPRRPLSDKEIVDLLAARGLPIARRTVAKYRTELGILPSNMRKRY